jgi:hypothetical protein
MEVNVPQVPLKISISWSKVPVDDIVVETPFPTKVYQTPYDDAQLPGAVSVTLPTVVPAKFVVPQDKVVASPQASFVGGHVLEVLWEVVVTLE